MLWMESGMVTRVNSVQDEKVLFGSSDSLQEMRTDFNAEQLEKEWVPSVVIESGMDSSCKLVHLENAPSPIKVSVPSSSR